MRKALALLLVLAAGAALARGITLIPGVKYEFTDCSSSGSSSQTIPTGEYLFRVKDADTFICYASTCPSGGDFFPAGTVIQLHIDSTSMSCRSSSSTGDVAFTRAE